ncbi:DUF6907 domain-containing protein [Streptomyces sp. SM1]|uniref:DUF6907 domain-containing protein n=1 Tax=Streptomyces sp. SM1 TaxID=402229 RepID=UPI000CD4E8CE|nr:hypothetical protein [Streptomyces sp. SM1]
MTEPRTITLATTDHGDVTISEPSWCRGHEDHLPEERADLAHNTDDVILKWRGQPLVFACLDQAPYADTASRDVHVSVSLVGQALDAREVYELAAALDTYADQLRTLADQLLVVRAEGDL